MACEEIHLYWAISTETFFLTLISACFSACMDPSMARATGTTGSMKGSRSRAGGPDRETGPVGM